MEIITIISILLPYFIFIIWAFNLKKDNRKLRAEFFKKLSDSETQRDNLFIDFQKVVIENFNIADRNSKGQDENWEKIGEVFHEFDSIINEIDKKVNTALDDQEKYSIKRDRYENRLTEVCKAFDDLNLRFNQNVYITVANHQRTTNQFNIVQRNFDKIKGLPKKVKEMDSLNLKVTEQSEATNRIITKITQLEAKTSTNDIRLNRLDENYDYIKKTSNDNFGCVNKVLGSIEINFNKIKDLPKKVDEIDRTLNLSLQRIGMNKVKFENLIKAIENPIEVTRPSCETKLKMKEQVNQNGIVRQIVNKVDFNHGLSYFKIGDIFRKKEDTVFVYRSGKIVKILNLDNTYRKNIYNKFLQLNEN